MQALEQRVLMSASLIKQINTTNADANPSNFATGVNELYFSATDGIHGQHVWQTNGTAAGTMPAVSLVPGAPQATMSDITLANGFVYFFAQGPNDGNLVGLYKSSGSAATTTELGAFNEPSNLINFNGTLYFTIPGSGSEQIWTSNGTASSTHELVTAPAVGFLTDADGELYFMDGTTLWKSDGTQAGTTAVASLANFAGNASVTEMVAVGNRVFISNSGQLWTSDGTAAGTQQVSNVLGIVAMAAYNGSLYFTTHDGVQDQLYQSDGTSQGTTLVVSETLPSIDNQQGAMAVVNNTLYFNLADSTHGEELWSSNGTAQGTQIVADINPGPANGLNFGNNYEVPADDIGSLNGKAYFPATDGVHGVQLWQTNGTAAGTSQVAQINSTLANASPQAGVTIGNTAYFTADDGIHGDELWKTDGTTGGTSMVADLNPGPNGSDPGSFFNFNGTLFFEANNGSQFELYRTDGTAAGTTVVYAGQTNQITQVGNLFYFLGGDSNGDTILYQSNGTAAGTVAVQTLFQGPVYFHGPIFSLASYNGSLYILQDGTTLERLNANDSITVVATVPGSLYTSGQMVVLNDELYFSAADKTNTSVGALWKSDGTAAGTQEVWSSGNPPAFSQLIAFGNNLFFYPSSGGSSVNLYRSDGTTAGTVLLSTLSGDPDDFTAAGNELYFVSPGGVSNSNLYETNGTAAGTKVVDPSLTDITSVQAVGGLLYFVAQNGGQSELFQTDGTTTQLVDPNEVSEGWTPSSLVGQVNDTVLMGASTPQQGIQLWGVPATSTTSAVFDQDDTTTGGNWTGVYGSDGYEVIGGTTDLPGYVTMTNLNTEYYEWAPPGAADQRAPQASAGSTAHVAACDFSPTSFSIDLNFAAGQSHQVALDLLDYDYQGRTETVQITDLDNGQLLDSRTIHNFQNGQYLVYDLSGDVGITFTNAPGSLNAVLSAILFSTPKSATASFAGTDITTQGQWTGVYGSQGYYVVDGSSNLPSTVNYSIEGEQFYEWATSTSDPRDLQTSPGSSNLVAACAYSNNPSFTINLDFLDNQTHQVSFYLLDYDARNRSETIQITNAATGAVLNTETFSDFTRGEYVRWDLSGDVNITFSNAGGLNEVFSGFFIDPAPVTATASFVKTDSTTMGSYTGVYGKDGYDVIDATANTPSYAELSIPRNLPTYVWADNTTAVNALQDSAGSTARIAACVYSNYPGFSFDLDLSDGQTHQVALYFLDYDNQNRSETVQISNAITNQVLDTETVSNFTGGKYLVWDLSGDVNITITNSGGLNEVLSGVFFG